MSRVFRSLAIFVGVALCVPAFSWTNVTVKKGESINAIAAKYRPSGVAQMDMVIAVRNANPNAIAKGVKPGTILRVPTTSAEVRQAITGVKQKAAKAEAPMQKKVAASKSVTKTASSAKVTARNTAPVLAKPAPKSVDTASASVNASAAKQIADYQATINNLQQALNNQAQTLQAYQTQIQDLTNQLNNGGQSTSSQPIKSMSFFSYADLWFLLWLVTFILFLRVRSKKARSVESVPRKKAVVNVAVNPTEEAVEPAAPIEVIRKEPTEENEQIERAEPALHQIGEEEWRQVELDIPTSSDAPAQTNIRLEPSFTPEEREELVGEQQNIIQAIANDHDNVEWHMALLEFYIKTANEHSFLRHMQTMMRTGLMSEGDGLWEKIRKMYLNGWVYKEEA